MYGKEFQAKGPERPEVGRTMKRLRNQRCFVLTPLSPNIQDPLLTFEWWFLINSLKTQKLSVKNVHELHFLPPSTGVLFLTYYEQSERQLRPTEHLYTKSHSFFLLRDFIVAVAHLASHIIRFSFFITSYSSESIHIILPNASKQTKKWKKNRTKCKLTLSSLSHNAIEYHHCSTPFYNKTLHENCLTISNSFPEPVPVKRSFPPLHGTIQVISDFHAAKFSGQFLIFIFLDPRTIRMTLLKTPSFLRHISFLSVLLSHGHAFLVDFLNRGMP